MLTDNETMCYLADLDRVAQQGAQAGLAFVSGQVLF